MTDQEVPAPGTKEILSPLHYPHGIIFAAGTLILSAILVAAHYRSEFYLCIPLLFFPIFYINKTVALYAFVLSFSYARPLVDVRLDFRLDDIMFFVIATIWFMDKVLANSSHISSKFLNRALLIWLGINVISIGINISGYDTTQIFKSSYYLFRTTQYVFIFIIVSDMITHSGMKLTIMRLLWLTSIIICGYGVYQVHVLGERVAISTLSDNHVHIGVYLSLTIFILIGYLFTTKNYYEKAFVLLTLPLLGYTLLLSASRTGIISAIFGMVVLALLLSRKYAWIILIATIAVVYVYSANLLLNLQEYELGVARFEELEGDLSFMARFYMWFATYNLILQHPLILITGVGLGGFLIALDPYVPLLPFGMTNAAHNHYIHHLVETGIIGLGVFLFIIITLFRTSYRRMRDRAIKFRYLYLGYFCGLAAIAVSGLTQDTLSVMEMAMWNFLGYFFLVTAVVFAEPENNKQSNITQPE